MKRSVLVVGGGGYIGSHTSWLLHENGYDVVVLDALFHGQAFNQPWATLFKSNFADEKVLSYIFTNYKIDCVMHFAALIEVGESVKKPREFYQNNVVKTLTLLNSMLDHGVDKFIFSSSCAVYGVPQKTRLDENHAFAPINPYGKNKLAVEFALQDYSAAYRLKYVALRYFNAAGAFFEKGLGEQHVPETHAIPLLLRAAMTEKNFYIFGDDYPTSDGSCIRDYVHVLDIAQAHISAYRYLEENARSDCFNLGSEKGFSVKQLVNAAEKVCGLKVKTEICPRRPGDVPILIADSAKAKSILGWEPKHSDLNNILNSAFEWEKWLSNFNRGI